MIFHFLVWFIVVAVVYAIVASTTDVFYRNKPTFQLSFLELQILARKATIPQRLNVFFFNVFCSIFAPPVYILALLLGTVSYFVFR